MSPTKFGRAAELITEKSPNGSFKVGLEAIESNTGRLLDADAEYQGDGTAFKKDDILFGKLRPYLAKSWLADRAGSAVGDFHVYRARPGVCPRFLHHVTLSQRFLAPVISSVYGAKMPRVGWDFVRDVEIDLPPYEVQLSIADYLDRETAQIDTLIAKQEELIGRLHFRRQALIKTEIAASIDPFAATDGTSVRVGVHFDVTLGKMLDAGKQRRDGDTDLPYIRAANIQDLGLDFSTVYSMPYSPEEAATLALRSGDLLVVEGGAVGTSVVLDVDMPGWSFQKTVNRVRAIDGWSTRWLGYLLRSYRDSGVIDVLCNGSTIQHLTAEKLRALRVPITDVDEQRRIVARLDEQTAKIDRLIANAERFIELAKERRAALITAAVTGQLDVTAA